MIALSDIERLRDQVGRKIDVRAINDHEFAIDVPLAFPDGDQCRVYVSKLPDAKWSVSDGGSAVMRASYASSVDVMGKGHADRFRQIVRFYGLTEAEGELRSVVVGDIGDAVFTIAQASLDIVHLARLPKEKKPRKKAAYRKALDRIITSTIPTGAYVHRWHDAATDPDGLYPVAYRIDKPAKRPIFVFRADTTFQCMSSTMACLFYKQSSEFLSVAIFAEEERVSANEAIKLEREVDETFPSIKEEAKIKDFLAAA
jgi:hypothetical protein